MKRNGTYWVLRGFLTVLLLSGITMFVFSVGALSSSNGVNIEGLFGSTVAVVAFDLSIPSVEWESLAMPDLCELAVDDNSRDSMDDFHMPSQLLEHVPVCPEFRWNAGPLRNHAAETVLSTQRIGCVWRC